MSHYKPYPAYKGSGIEWIGEVPDGWVVKPFFALVKELNRKNIGLVETNILSLSYGNIIQKPEARNLGLTPESYETYQIVEPGEIVFRFTDLQNDKRSLRSAQVLQRGIITSAYMAVNPHGINSTYFSFLMRSYDLCKVFYTMGGGLRQSLKFEDVKRLTVVIPSPNEQKAIAQAIDHETTRIDTLITKKTRFIELLKEKRQALITHAVIKGLNPDAPMKDSGIEWIGEVPEHWGVGKLKHFGSLKGGAGFPTELQGKSDNELPFYKVGDLSKSLDGIYLGETINTVSRDEASKLGAKVFPEDTIIWAKIGAALLLNRRRITKNPSCLDNNMTGFIVSNEKAFYKYAFYLMCSIDFDFYVRPGAVPSLSEGEQSAIPMPIPPIDEQAAIAEAIDRETARIDTLITKTQNSIELLKERRSAFITAAVTGQIDCRGTTYE